MWSGDKRWRGQKRVSTRSKVVDGNTTDADNQGSRSESGELDVGSSIRQVAPLQSTARRARKSPRPRRRQRRWDDDTLAVIGHPKCRPPRTPPPMKRHRFATPPPSEERPPSTPPRSLAMSGPPSHRRGYAGLRDYGRHLPLCSTIFAALTGSPENLCSRISTGTYFLLTNLPLILIPCLPSSWIHSSGFVRCVFPLSLAAATDTPKYFRNVLLDCEINVRDCRNVNT